MNCKKAGKNGIHSETFSAKILVSLKRLLPCKSKPQLFVKKFCQATDFPSNLDKPKHLAHSRDMAMLKPLYCMMKSKDDKALLNTQHFFQYS